MIQFLKSYTHNDKKIVIGTKCTFWGTVEEDLISKGIAKRTVWNGKIEKLKTDFFKPKA